MEIINLPKNSLREDLLNFLDIGDVKVLKGMKSDYIVEKLNDFNKENNYSVNYAYLSIGKDNNELSYNLISSVSGSINILKLNIVYDHIDRKFYLASNVIGNDLFGIIKDEDVTEIDHNNQDSLPYESNILALIRQKSDELDLDIIIVNSTDGIYFKGYKNADELSNIFSKADDDWS